MTSTILSFFDQFPEFNGVQIHIRGTDGYFNATHMQKALNKRFSNWTRNKFTQQLLTALSSKTGLPITYEETEEGYSNLSTPTPKPLIDYDRDSGEGIYLHPLAAISFAMSNPEFHADVMIWIYNLARIGTVNPHYLTWTIEEYQRGLEFNHDDVDELYYR